MSNFKIGDKVRLVPDRISRQDFTELYLKRLVGKTLTISHVSPVNLDIMVEETNIDLKQGWLEHEKAFKPKLKVGDIVRILPRQDGWKDQLPRYEDCMIQYADYKSKVTKIHSDGTYSLSTVNHIWHSDWLELVEQEKENTMKSKLDLFMLSKLAINTRTQEQYNSLMKQLESKTELLFGGEKPTVYNQWSVDGSETYISVSDDGEHIMCGNIDSLINKNMDLFTYDEFMSGDEAVKEFKQSDLEIGMLVESEIKQFLSIDNEEQLDAYKDHTGISKIFKLNNNGDYIKIWEKPIVKLYTLELPNCTNEYKFYNVNKEDPQDYVFSTVDDIGKWKMKFTIEEIDALPNRDLIGTLIPNEVIE